MSNKQKGMEIDGDDEDYFFDVSEVVTGEESVSSKEETIKSVVDQLVIELLKVINVN